MTPEETADQPPLPDLPERALVVSLHDVSPLTLEPCQEIITRLEAIGLSHCSLLVIPHHHRQQHLLDSAACGQWLQERHRKGDEIVLHGYYHRRDRKLEETLRDRITTRIYTADEGEFYDIAGADALRLAGDGRQELRRLGLHPKGFIAPAWLLGDQAEKAIAMLGFDYTTRLRTIIDLAEGRTYASQSLVWSVRSFLRRRVSLRWNRSLFKRLQNAPLMRVGIHPVDIAHPAIWRQIEELIQRALADRVPLTYERWVENSRRRFHAL